MLDSRRLTVAARRTPLPVEDRRPATVSDDPVQRRDLVLLERARAGDLDAFNDLVVCYQDFLFALVVRMVPDRDQASDAVQEAFFSAYRHMRAFRGGSVRSWLSRIAINAAMDQQRLRKRRPSQPYRHRRPPSRNRLQRESRDSIEMSAWKPRSAIRSARAALFRYQPGYRV